MKTNAGHLTYCTNIHAGESWPEHFAALRQNFPVIKSAVSPNASMGLGLRLSHLSSLDLVKQDNLSEFKQWLQEQDAYVFTMNGFPYGGFHRTVVKDMVHAPDWTTNDRVAYTTRLFLLLKDLLPAGMDGGISTSPLSYKYWYKNETEKEKAVKTATAHIMSVAEVLIHIRLSDGIVLHLDIEPEPDGLLESGEEYIQWYEQYLLPLALITLSKKFGLSAGEAEKLIKEHICLCYDVCHFAVGYESHAQMIAQLKERQMRVGKIQISAALKGTLANNRQATIDAFSHFNETVYLHQVVAKTDTGLLRYPDLPQALEDAGNTAVQEWRAHFHVPVFTAALDPLQTTQTDIQEVLALQTGNRFTEQLEVETYTWEVLPDALRLPLNDSIIRELQWVKNQL